MSDPRHRGNILTPLIGAAVIIALLGATYYVKLQADARAQVGGAEQGEAAVEVITRQVVRQALPVRVEVRGFFEGFAEVRVHSEVAGRMASKVVADGQAVDAGEPLYRVDETFYQIGVEQAEAAVTVARADRQQARTAVEVAAARLEEVQAARQQARIEFDRIASLFEKQHAPKLEYDRADAALQRLLASEREAAAGLRQATQQVEAGSAAVALAEVRLTEAREMFGRCIVRSPLAGRVDRMLLEEGEYVIAGQPIADVIRLDRLKLFVEVTGRQLGALGEELVGTVVADALPAHEYAAVVDHVAPRADPVSRKFRVELHVDNEDGRLLAGMSALCQLSSPATQKRLTLPTTALVRRYGLDHCYAVVTEGERAAVRLTRVRIRALPGRLDVVELLEGLAAGDVVVVEALAELRDGAAVEVRSEK